MSVPDPITPEQSFARDAELRLNTRRSLEDTHPSAVADRLAGVPPAPRPRRYTPARVLRATALSLVALAILAVLVVFGARLSLRSAAHANLPQLDGSLTLAGLSAPVTVQRDTHGVPTLTAASLDDLLIAQAFITASDRLFQMDSLRRHAAGELAEILGPSLLPHDRLQRTLQLRAAADRAVAALPPDQLHMLEQYAKGVNAAIQQETAASSLPVEFRILHYTPRPWTPRDSILISLAMFQDLTNQYPTKLAREALTARIPSNLVADLYPVGSWRDHPPTTPEPDLTVPGPPIEQIPLDESQSSLRLPIQPGAPRLEPETWALNHLSSQPTLCPDCTPGSNNWVVSGAHTASRKPLLSNDMHLNLSVPDIWYEASLRADGSSPVDVAGVTIPGLPLVVVGHNQHIAWGFTNLGADVQDLYLETLRNDGSEFRAADGSWQPVTHIPEWIHVRGGRDQTLDITATKHGDTLTPILTPELKGETRPISLRWTLYDPSVLQMPQLDLAQAHDWPSFLAALQKFGGPAQNVVYADDQGHIGYHASGRIPLRGPATPHAEPTAEATTVAQNPGFQGPVSQDAVSQDEGAAQLPDAAATSPFPTAANPVAVTSNSLSPVPVVATAQNEWSGYIPFEQLPQVFDPPGGVIATANARVTPDDYPYPITLNWAAPYRNERIWHLLAHRNVLSPADMLAIQSDIYSDFDHVLAQRLAYAIDRSTQPKSAQLSQAADLLRSFNGQMTADSPAAAIVLSVHNILWRVLLEPHIQNQHPGEDLSHLYLWGERDYALEQILQHTPTRWLPPGASNWDDVLASAVSLALKDANAPADLSKWRYGSIHMVDLENPLFAQFPFLTRLLGMPTGTGSKPQSGDTTTVKQVARTFGPSERLTVDLANPAAARLNLTTGESGDPASPHFLDQFPLWYHVTTQPLASAPVHTLIITP